MSRSSSRPVTLESRVRYKFPAFHLKLKSLDYPAPYAIDGPTGCLGPNLDIFNPTWPGTCPFVTSVGATKVYPGHTVNEPESAVYDPAGYPYSVNYSSGGGFSNLYSIPEYQADAVATYFKKHDPKYPYYSALAPDTGDIRLLVDVGALAGSTGGIYNRIGRGIPDVSANGDNIAVYVGGDFGLSGGTSASTPIFASVINRINEERLIHGKGPIGFLNPSLYANPSMLNDIKNGKQTNRGPEFYPPGTFELTFHDRLKPWMQHNWILRRSRVRPLSL